MPESYNLSSGSLVTQQAHRAFVNSYQGFADNAIHIPTMETLGWFNDTFACNTIGDIDFVSGVYEYTSSNSFNNIMVGLKHAMHKTEAATNQIGRASCRERV